MTSWALDKDNSVSMNELIENLKKVPVYTNLNTNIAALVASILQLRQKKWGDSTNFSPEATALSWAPQKRLKHVTAWSGKGNSLRVCFQRLLVLVEMMLSHGGPSTRCFERLDEPVFYGPDGQIITPEESKFLQESTEATSEVEDNDEYGIGKILVTETRHCACPAKPRRRLDCQTSRAFSVLLARDSESSSGGLEPLFHAGPVDSTEGDPASWETDNEMNEEMQDAFEQFLQMSKNKTKRG
uniref:Uncharacterized protein n=1 Tax=Timema shepardi TaxID=629360 RepID=A0A7R9B928_TIMSH|nr:unnamed protein product [Timema shepardi]